MLNKVKSRNSGRKTKMILAIAACVVALQAQAQWTKTGAVIAPTVLTDNVSVGTTVNGANIYAEKTAAVNLGIKSSTLSATMFMDKGSAAANAAFAYKTLGTTLWNSGMLGNNNFNIKNVSLNTTPLRIDLANDNMALCTQGGKVGIGNASPSFKLDISGDCRINTAPQNTTFNSLILNSNTTATSYDKYEPLKLINTGNFGGATNSIGFYGGFGSNIGKITSILNSSGNGAGMLFSVGDNNLLIQPRMMIDNQGSVGIGTTSPSAKLTVQTQSEVYGIVHTDGTVKMGTYIGLNVYNNLAGGWLGTESDHPMYFMTNNNWPQITLLQNGNVGFGSSNPHAQLQFDNGLNNRRIVLWEGVDNEHQFAGFGMNANTLRYQVEHLGGNHVFYAAVDSTSSNELMRIQGDGRVAIGGDASSNYKLTVRGSIICTDLRVQLQPFPDYVFANDYKLLPLNELENYVNKNNHLPGMPTATEVEEQEVTVGQLQMKLVEKVEELTLYVIELNKANEQLKNNNAALVERVKLLEKK
ncbi:MAG TPA: hypothetical protein PK736_05825 [Bacteroidia bacterium]|nr:hypothetical protein [Bacteroidia bacterium]